MGEEGSKGFSVSITVCITVCRIVVRTVNIIDFLTGKIRGQGRERFRWRTGELYDLTQLSNIKLNCLLLLPSDFIIRV